LTTISVIPSFVDWVGYDCYGDLDHCGNWLDALPNSQEYMGALSQSLQEQRNLYSRSIDEYLCVLTSKMNPNQRLMLIPQAVRGVATIGADDASEQILIERWKRVMAIAKSPFYPVIAVFPFLWDCPTCDKDINTPLPGGHNARTMPRLTEQLRDFSRELPLRR